MTEKILLQTLSGLKNIIPFIPTIVSFIRRLFRHADEAIVLDDIGLKNLQYCSSRKCSLFFIEKSAFFLLKGDIRRDLKEMRLNDFEMYVSQILPLLKRQKTRYDETFMGHKDFIILNSVKLARKMGLKYYHFISDDELFQNEIKTYNLNEQRNLTIQRDRLKNEKKAEKQTHEYSSFNEMNKLILNICKGDLNRKLTLENVEENKEDEL